MVTFQNDDVGDEREDEGELVEGELGEGADVHRVEVEVDELQDVGHQRDQNGKDDFVDVSVSCKKNSS